MIGRTLAHYRITAAIGAGGMGEVYRATDTKVGREVALKLLPRAFASDPERLARFNREARLLASLNHPNIAHLYGFEAVTLDDATAAHFIVMELVEGEDLAERVKRGALPVDEAIAIAKQIVEALEQAHEKGIVHRDLKPANVKLTPDRKVKVLDFGLAKAYSADPANSGSPDLSHSPTTTRQGTEAGVILGTAAYMSPEQARGQAADRRADIWAFGVVLFEMLTGTRLFGGMTVSDTLVAVLTRDVDWTALPRGTPAGIRRLLLRCLDRDPHTRLRDIGEARVAIEGPAADPGEPEPAPPAAGSNRVSVALGLGLVLATLGLTWTYLTRRPAAEARVVKLSIPPPDKANFAGVAASPDGRWLAFTAATGGKVQLWVRALDATESKALGGTEGATLPFWSPDSRAIGFFANGKLKKIDAAGGVVSALCDVVGVATGGTWSREAVVLFSHLGGAGLSRVSASGGDVVSVQRVDPEHQETDYANPFFLPDGHHFLYNAFGGQKEVRGVYVGSLEGGMRQRLLSDHSNAVYAASSRTGGFLLFGRDGALVAQAFDAGTLQLKGDAFPIAPHLGANFDTTAGGAGRRLVSAADSGVLVFDPFPNRQSSHLVWVDRGGQPAGAPVAMENVSMVRLSPDGKRYAVSRLDPETGSGDIWVSDGTSGGATRLTFDPGNDTFPVWSPDGSRLVWASNRAGRFRLYQKAASGSGQDALLLESDLYVFPMDWSRDGRTILYRQLDPKTKYDIWALPVGPQAGDAKPFPFLRTEANEAAAVFSPDGRWVAYASDESGQYEVYVQGFPAGGGKRQVSTSGGIAPQWRSDGSEIFYHALDGALMAAAVERGAGFAASPPAALFEFRPSGPIITPYYGVAPDGRRFLLSTIVDTIPGAPFTVILNWTAALKE